MNSKYANPNNNLFIKNRTKFSIKIKDGGMAVFHSNDEAPRNGDAYFTFRQQSDIYYLTGIDQEDTILVLFPSSPNPLYREMLFIKETSEQIAIWDGARLTPNQAHEVSGISNVFWYHEFWRTIHAAFLLSETIYLNLNENDRFTDKVPYAGLRFAQEIIAKYPAHSTKRSAPILADLRMRKEPEEIEQLKQAIAITKKGFDRLLTFVKPGVMEYEIEAELIHEFIRNRSRGFAFDPIIAGGANACVLHYIDNNKMVKDGDLILLDFGAEYGNYNGDLSRTIPVNGKFTQRQKDVYNAVLNVQRFAKTLLKPGISIPAYHEEVCKFMTEELLKLNLLSQEEVKANPKAFMKYYMHGTSHHLGLDVHDVMHRWGNLDINNVVTVEPGIYIREEGIGIRIENDVIITQTGVIDLMDDFIIETDEIEAAMAK
ncbi:MAG: aminopeptidase P family protein [Bacteroidota bacterium]|jgi:Xaa-Pro aminopeptidase